MDIFPEAKFTSTVKTSDNFIGMGEALKAVREKEGLVFINLLDFDMKWGHRRNVAAYGRGAQGL